MNARSVFVIAVSIVAIGCGSPTPTPTPTPTAVIASTPVPEGGVERTAPATLPMRLPASSAFRMSVDLSAVDGPAIKALRPLFAFELAALGIDESENVLTQLGVDGSRPMSFALVGFPDDARAALDPLLPDAARRAPGAWKRVKQVIDGARWILMQRVLVPVTDAARFSKRLEVILNKDGHGEGGVYVNRRGRGATRVTTDGKTVAIDTVATDASKIKEAFAALDEKLRTGAEAPSLDGGQVHAMYRPSEIATVGMVSGMEMTIGAISGDSIDASQRERIAEQGLYESSQSYVLAGAMNGAYFEDVDVRLGLGPSKLDLVLRAKTGPGFHTPPEAAWGETVSVVAPGATPKLDVSRAFIDGWSLPGEPPSGGFFMAVKEAGVAFGALTALPNVAVFAARSYENGGALLLAAKTTKLDRVGTLASGNDGKETILFGVMAPGATKADAQKAATALGVTATIGATSILEVEHRFVVLLAKDRAALPKTVTLSKRGPFVVGLSPLTLLSEIRLPLKPGSIPDHLTGTVARDNGAIVIKVASP